MRSFTRKVATDLTAAIALCVAGLTASAPAGAQEVTLKLHQFLPAQANVPKLILDVWADTVEAASDGRIKIDRYPSMQLGGTPPGLIDQAIDGVADIVWTVVGYTPGRFPRTEVFELPFTMTNAAATSCAYWKLFETDMKDADFKDLHVLGTWVHGPGVIHSKEPVETIDDMAGVKVRGASRVVNDMLSKLGATPVGMPVPAVPEALSKGVIDATTIPWEVTTGLKVPELVSNHTEFTGKALYTLTFVLAMNKAKYESLPEDLQRVIDDKSGLEFSIFAGRTQQAADAPAREAAVNAGNTIVTLDAEQVKPWQEAARATRSEWIDDLTAQGIDAEKLVADAERLIEECAAR